MDTAMKAPETPSNESDRLQALIDLNIVYSPAEERFDRITRIAQRIMDVPIALISLVTEDKQWFKSCQGLTVSETSREISFCGHAILSDDILVIPNTLKDPDFRDNPLVADEPGIRFYAGQPIHAGNQRIGTLCVIDQRPRQLKPGDYDSLKSLAGWIELELEAWHTGKNMQIERVLRLTDRQFLLDPVTGNLNRAGVAKLQEEFGNEIDLSRHIQISVSNSDKVVDEAKKLDMLQKFAQIVRESVGERGIVGTVSSDCFLIILSEAEANRAQALIADLETALAAAAQHIDEICLPKFLVELKSTKI